MVPADRSAGSAPGADPREGPQNASPPRRDVVLGGDSEGSQESLRPASEDPRLAAARAVLPACQWCNEKPEVAPSQLAGNVSITIAHQHDCPITRHPKLAREYRKTVTRAMRALETAAAEHKTTAWLDAAAVSRARER